MAPTVPSADPNNASNTLTPNNADAARPVSFITSRMADIVSNDSDLSESSQPTWSQPPPSRRGPPPSKRFSMTGASSNQGTSRPTSAASRISRTHVPSLTSHAFFRPMSSQRLQAQRGARPLNTPGGTSIAQSTHGEDGLSDEASHARRSFVSNTTIRQGLTLHDTSELPPPSRGTECTDPMFPDRGTSNASPTGNTTVRSLGESVRLLNDRSQGGHVPQHLSLGKNFKTGASSNDPPQRSPLSFRSGFLMPGKNDAQDSRNSSGHERLSSAASTPTDAPKKSIETEPKPKLGKNHEYFLGNTAFFAGGRFQNARDRPINIATGIFVVLPGALFFAFSAPWLWHNISPAIPIVFAYIFYICVSSFIHASVVDPGIIPRNLHHLPAPHPSEDPLALGPSTNDWVMIKLATSDVAAMDVPVKYCKTCSIWRPPRCYHCRVCDNCVETLDHHCVWLNNCVGRRNYRYFFGFVSSATILGLFLIGASLAHCLVYSSKEGISFGEAIDRNRVPFAMVIYGALASPYPASLWAYHFFLMGRGETTREYLNSHKFPKADRHRPFTQGNIFKNWIAVLGRPRAPTYMQFKKTYQHGDQRFASEKRKHRVVDLEAQADGVEMHKVSHPVPAFERPPSSSSPKQTSG
ncbi:hypothetical protein AJ80_01675 [Polytolypa hystricis UAMH7299]|uniref:Palmitoyltransferase n=1 Tax=Polytolypa hystricis (strain UAMH7299) TaxID=1447883 RepID=A0A2B7Z0G3_POLH7|nr:hypothetical protein AJ80_01675 [Polytolypa hystricis UAMH7299]